MFADVSMCQEKTLLLFSIAYFGTKHSSSTNNVFIVLLILFYTLSVSFLPRPFLQNSSFRNSSYVDYSISSWYLLNLNQFGAISCFWRPPPPPINNEPIDLIYFFKFYFRCSLKVGG